MTRGAAANRDDDVHMPCGSTSVVEHPTQYALRNRPRQPTRPAKLSPPEPDWTEVVVGATFVGGGGLASSPGVPNSRDVTGRQNTEGPSTCTRGMQVIGIPDPDRLVVAGGSDPGSVR